jgi:hypothetical protein
VSRPLRPAPPPIDNDGVAAVTVGTALWAVALVVMLLLRADLEDDGRGWWIWTCVAGFALGLLGIAYCVRRRAAIRRGEQRD